MPIATTKSHDEHRPSLANSQGSTIINCQQDDDTTINSNDQSSHHSIIVSTGKCDQINEKDNYPFIKQEQQLPPERITIIESPLNKIDVQLNHIEGEPEEETVQSSSSSTPSQRIRKKNMYTTSYLVIYQWIKKQCTNPDNRYAFQMAVAFIISTLFVVIDPISDVFPNTFWVGVSVVTVLDNTVGGFLSLSLQRLMGTLIGGCASIVSMTITRAAFHPRWEWEAVVLLCFLMFIQVFFIAKLKTRPNMAYTGGIGLLTTIIITLSGYSDLIHDRISYCAELGAWRTLNLIIGIFIAMLVAFFVFPLKASKIMRKNIGKAMEDTANLYEKTADYYLSYSEKQKQQQQQQQQGDDIEHVLTQQFPPPPPMATAANTERRRNSIANSFYTNHKSRFSIKEILRRAFSTKPPESNDVDTLQEQQKQMLERDHDSFGHDTIKKISTGAFAILSQLQTESNRLKNVSTEYTIQTVFHFFGGGKDRCLKDLRRANRYNQAIDAMKHMVWPLVSFQLLLPLITINSNTIGANQMMKTKRRDSIYEEGTGESEEGQSDDDLQARITPTQDILDCFSDSIQVMRQLASILKQKDKPLSGFFEEWTMMDRKVTLGSNFIQRELKRLIHQSNIEQQNDHIKLLSYYGFMVRCSVIWEDLRTIVEKLSPLNGTLSRASSMAPLPNREPLHVTE